MNNIHSQLNDNQRLQSARRAFYWSVGGNRRSQSGGKNVRNPHTVAKSNLKLSKSTFSLHFFRFLINQKAALLFLFYYLVLFSFILVSIPLPSWAGVTASAAGTTALQRPAEEWWLFSSAPGFCSHHGRRLHSNQKWPPTQTPNVGINVSVSRRTRLRQRLQMDQSGHPQDGTVQAPKGQKVTEASL